MLEPSRDMTTCCKLQMPKLVETCADYHGGDRPHKIQEKAKRGNSLLVKIEFVAGRQCGFIEFERICRPMSPVLHVGVVLFRVSVSFSQFNFLHRPSD